MTRRDSPSGRDDAQGVQIPVRGARLDGELDLPPASKGVVLFAHGSGSSRHSPRNQFVARSIREAGIGTLLFDLLTAQEETLDLQTRHLRFDIGLLAERLAEATCWIKSEPQTRKARDCRHRNAPSPVMRLPDRAQERNNRRPPSRSFPLALWMAALAAGFAGRGLSGLAGAVVAAVLLLSAHLTVACRMSAFVGLLLLGHQILPKKLQRKCSRPYV